MTTLEPDGPDHRIFVIADNYRHFQAWCWDRNWHARHRNLRYVTSGTDLRGYADVDLRIIGWPSLSMAETDYLREAIAWIKEAQCPRPTPTPGPLTTQPFRGITP